MRKIELVKKLLLLQDLVIKRSAGMVLKMTMYDNAIKVDLNGVKYTFKNNKRDNWVATLEKIENKIYEEE